MNCTNCNAEVKEGKSFCANCGASITSSASAATAPPAPPQQNAPPSQPGAQPYATPSQAQPYAQPQPGAPQYAQPQPGAQPYATPSQAQPYAQPQAGAPQYAPPQPGAPQYAQPQPGAPQYAPAPPPGAPQYAQPQTGAPKYAPPQPGAPQYAPPQPGVPQYAPPQPGAPQYAQPRPGAPQYAPAPPPMQQRPYAPAGSAAGGAPKKPIGFIVLAAAIAVGFFVIAGLLGWLPIGGSNDGKPAAGDEIAASEDEDNGNDMTPEQPPAEEAVSEPESEDMPETPEQTAESFAAAEREALLGYWYTDFDYEGWQVYLCVAFNKNGEVFYSDGYLDSEPSTYIVGKYTIGDGEIHVSGKNEFFDDGELVSQSVEIDYTYSIADDTLKWCVKGKDPYTLYKAKPKWSVPIPLD